MAVILEVPFPNISTDKVHDQSLHPNQCWPESMSPYGVIRSILIDKKQGKEYRQVKV